MSTAYDEWVSFERVRLELAVHREKAREFGLYEHTKMWDMLLKATKGESIKLRKVFRGRNKF